MAAGGAPSAAKTGSAVLTSGTPGRESVRAITSSREPGSSGNDWRHTGSSSNGGSYVGAVAGRPTKLDIATREQPLTSQVTDIFSRISRVSRDQSRLDERLVELDKQQSWLG